MMKNKTLREGRSVMMIYIAYGKDLVNMTMDLMAAARVHKELYPSMSVCIKPHLSIPQQASYGATTHPQVVEGVINYLQQHGVYNITIAESGWIGRDTRQVFQATGMDALARRKNVQLLAVDEDETITLTHDLLTFNMSKSVSQCDYLINLPVLKPHSQFVVSGALRNYTGLMSRKTQQAYYTHGPQRTIAKAAQIITPQLHIMDNICGDLKSELGRTPIYQDRLLLCRDGLLLDSYASTLLGYSPLDVPYLVRTREHSGAEFYNPQTNHIKELGKNTRPLSFRSAYQETQKLSCYIVDRKACSCCKAASIYALYRLSKNDKLNPAPLHRHPKLYVGQGHKGKSLNHLGVGDCCSQFSSTIPGCPPTALQVYNEILKKGCF